MPLTILSPENGVSLSDNMAEVRGESKNLNFISLNDRQIFVDDKGSFKEKILLYPGENTFRIFGKDKFGREITQYIRVVAPETHTYPTVALSGPPSASSTKKTDLSNY